MSLALNVFFTFRARLTLAAHGHGVACAHLFREHAGAWGKKIAYHESIPHLLLMAFSQRIINGRGTIAREYALGRKRVDIYITWKKQSFVIELNIKRGEDTLKKGLTQTAEYVDLCGAEEAHLIIL